MVGITYPLMAFKLAETMVVGIQDASFSNDHEVSKGGVKMGNRSQSGRLLCLGPPEFKEEKAGQLMLIEWHSTTLKKVCRSTTQAETLSLLHGVKRRTPSACIPRLVECASPDGEGLDCGCTGCHAV